MEAGDEREALAEIVDRLCAALGYPDDGSATFTPPPTPSHHPLGALLSPEDEQLISTARRGLARIATALGADGSGSTPESRTMRMLIDGAELVMRNELAAGNPVIEVLPSFVYLIALPVLEQNEALELSNRTASLLEEARR